MKRCLALLLTVLAACGHAHPAAAPSAAPTAAAPAAPATLKRLENGDRACYVVLDTATGEQSKEGDFELCAGGQHDASALIGKKVVYTTEKAKVLAASCGGDESCGKSDEVDLITTLTVAP